MNFDLEQIEDPTERARAAGEVLARLSVEADRVRMIRDQAVLTLLDAGTQGSEVARIIGVTKGFVKPYYTRLRASLADAAPSV